MASFENQTTGRKIIFFLALIVVIGFLGFFLGRRGSSPQSEIIEDLASPQATVEIGQEASFPIQDTEDEEADFKFIITEAKKVKLVATQGEPIKADPGKIFLVLSLEIDNDNPFDLSVTSKNYFRLVGEEDKKYAPDFYNDVVEVPADSVKKDELGFVVSDDQKNFKLLLGPINEMGKTEVEINF